MSPRRAPARPPGAADELAAIVECSRDAVIGISLDGTLTSWNPAAERLYGWTADEAVGARLNDRVVAATGEPDPEEILRRVASGEAVPPFETIRISKDGSRVHMSAQMFPIVAEDEIVAAASISRDVGERIRGEDALRRSDMRYQMLLKNLPDAMVVLFDSQHRIEFAGGPLLEMLDATPSELAGLPLDALIPRGPGKSNDAVYRRALSGHRAVHEFRVGSSPGRVISCEAVPFNDSTGAIVGGMVLARDVTAQRRAENDVRAARRFFEEAFNNAPVGMAMVSAAPEDRGRYIRVNNAFTHMLGRPALELVGSRPSEATVPEDAEIASREVEQMLDGELGQLSPKRYRRPDGTVRSGVSTAGLVRAADGAPRYALEVIADTTEWVEAEREQERLKQALEQAQKLEAIGRLAGGVAHDFNNLLSVILNYAELARDEALADEALSEISRAATRAADLTRRLLVFASHEVTEPALLGVNSIVRGMQTFLARTIPENIALEFDLSPVEHLVLGDKSQLEQSLINLAINARDAISGRGSVRVSTGSRRIGAGFPGLAPGLYAELRVTDDGVGMHPEMLARACEPFFTTKESGQGTGLGLAMLYGVATAAGGTILIDSAPGVGTDVCVLLPIAPGRPAEKEADPLPAPPDGDGRRVLLVEDEETVRRLIGRILASHGYHVLSAADGQEALELYEREPSVDILLTDVVMPSMSGPELARALAARGSGANILFMTGYTDRPATIPADAPILRKPFDAEDLLRQVAAAA